MCILHSSKVSILSSTSSIMITLKMNMVTTQDYYSLILSLKLKIFLKILVKIKKSWILVIIQLSQNIMVIQTNWLLVR